MTSVAAASAGDRRDQTESEKLTPTSSSAGEHVAELKSPTPSATPFRPTKEFWLIVLSLMIATFLSALDLTALSTALPSIVDDLDTDLFVWVTSAYALASTAVLPWYGGLADIFGRRPLVLSSIGLFALGSAVSGAAQNGEMLVAGRVVQGLGGGGILASSEIILADLVPLAQRGTYFSLFGMVWAIAQVHLASGALADDRRSAIGPLIGGSLGGSGSNWRWLFFLNLPVSAIAFTLVAMFLRVRAPAGSWRDKARQIDWLGNGIFIAATTSFLLSVTWAGVEYAWSSVQVLAPMILGLAGLAAFVVYERFGIRGVVRATLPRELSANRTTGIGYLTTFLHGIVSIVIIFTLPVYLQAVFRNSPILSGVHILPIAFMIAPFAMVAGISTVKSGRYLPQQLLGFAVMTLGTGLLTLYRVDSSLALVLGLELVVGPGIGFGYATPNFLVLGPLDPKLTASAMSFAAFARSAGQVLGTVISGVVLQNVLQRKLPVAFLDSFAAGSSSVAYALVPVIPTLDEPLQSAVRQAFADAVRLVFIVAIPLAGVGFFVSLFAKQYTLSTVNDEAYALETQEERRARSRPTSTAVAQA